MIHASIVEMRSDSTPTEADIAIFKVYDLHFSEFSRKLEAVTELINSTSQGGASLSSMTVNNLRSIAKSYKIEKYYAMNKASLIKYIKLVDSKKARKQKSI
jgi:hypothetical protein